ncbi:MAG: hypothetical protein AB7F29_18485 [Candidatus Nitrosocosmicus sp.]
MGHMRQRRHFLVMGPDLINIIQRMGIDENGDKSNENNTYLIENSDNSNHLPSIEDENGQNKEELNENTTKNNWVYSYIASQASQVSQTS